MWMNLKSRMLSTEIEIECYQEIRNIYKKQNKTKIRAFQNIVAIFKINSIDFSFFCFYMLGF